MGLDVVAPTKVPCITRYRCPIPRNVALDVIAPRKSDTIPQKCVALDVLPPRHVYEIDRCNTVHVGLDVVALEHKTALSILGGTRLLR